MSVPSVVKNPFLPSPHILRMTVNGQRKTFPIFAMASYLDQLQPTATKSIAQVREEISSFGLTETIEKIDKEIGFWNKIGAVPPSILKKISLSHLQLASLSDSFKGDPIEYALMSDQEVYSIPLSDLPEGSDRENLVRKKLEILEAKGATYQTEGLCVGSLRTLRGAPLQKAIEQGPRQALCFLKSEQIADIDFSRLSLKAILGFFLYPERYLLLSSKQLLDLIEKEDEASLSSIPVEGMPRMRALWPQLTHSAKISFLNGSKAKYNALSPERFTELLNKMDPIELFSVPKKSLHLARIYELKQETIATLFDHSFDNEVIAVFRQIPGEDLNKILPRLGACLASATPLQLKSIDFTKASSEQVQIIFPPLRPLPDRTHRIETGFDGRITHHFSSKTGSTSLGENQFQQMLTMQRAENLTKFQALSEVQKNAIRPFLTEDNRELLGSLD